MWKNFALIPLALLAAFMVIEAVARLWLPMPDAYPLPPQLLVLEERQFWVPEPGYSGVMSNTIDFQNKKLSVNPDGARYVPCASDQAGSVQRIFVLGDSQTFGFGLSDNETWPNRLQCALRDRGGSPPAVHNLGVYATNIDQYAKRGIRQIAPGIRAGDMVIVGVTWNDLISPQPQANIDRGRADAAAVTPTGGAVTFELQTPLKRLNTPTWRYRVYQRTGLLVPTFNSLKGFAESLTYSSVLARIIMPRLRLLYYRFRAEDSFVRQLQPGTVDGNFDLLASLAGAIMGQGGQLIVYLLPNRLFFDDVYYEAYSAAGKSFPARDYMSYLAKPLCEKHALTCLSAFDALKTSKRNAYTFEFDGHYNAQGASQVAAHLYTYLDGPCRNGARSCLVSEK